MDKFADCEMKNFSPQMSNAGVSQPSRRSDFAVIFSGNLNDLVQHGLRALRETLPTEQDLTTKVRLPARLLLQAPGGTPARVC